MLEKVTREQVIWLSSAVIATFIVSGDYPRIDLILNPEYILDILIMFVFVSAIGVFLGKVLSKVIKREVVFKTAVIVNILLAIGSLF